MNTLQLLDKISENILIADIDYNIVWLNQSAKELLKIIGPYVQIENPEDFIGQNLSRFHSRSSQEYIENGPFPHSATITLFQKFKSNIVVNVLTSETGEKVGYILTWKDLTEFDNILKERDEQLKEIDTPIIPLANDISILVPILGKLTDERISHIEEKVLVFCSENHISDILFDFSGVLNELDPQTASRLQQMQGALRLMGAEPIYVGIRPDMARSMVRDQIFIGAKTFKSFKQGIFYIWNKSGFTLSSPK
jgi:anti-anti-sigma regulatory factor